ncbi:MAG: mechanosensitive ion channel [bacterium]|nr:mechanosensitive ion channel [bacterium]
MDLSFLNTLASTLAASLPRLLLALGVLILGWLVAVIVRAIVRKSLGLLKLNDRVRNEAGGKMDLEGAAAGGAFYIVLLLALIAFFNALNLPLVSAPLQSLVNELLAFLPNLIAGGVLILVAWLLATLLRKGAVKALSATQIDEKLSDAAGMKPMSENLGNVLYGLVLLLFIPAVLGALKLEGLLVPVQGMVDKILLMLPNVLTGLVIGVVGWYVARLLRQMVTSLLEATGADRLGQRVGLAGTMTLSKLVGLLVFVFVFVPALTQALQALKMEAISQPATETLGTFMGAVPKLFAAAAILAVAFYLSKFLSGLAASLLAGIGFDTVPERLGLGGLFKGTTASRFVGTLIAFFIVLFAAVEAAGVMGFYQVSELVGMFIEFGGQVLLGVAIIGVGLWIANLAHAGLSRLDRPEAGLMAGLARFAILGIIFAMGLRAMDLANEIVEAAFYLTLGAVAVAVALSFGLGGREAAGRQMEHWLSRLRDRG